MIVTLFNVILIILELMIIGTFIGTSIYGVVWLVYELGNVKKRQEKKELKMQNKAYQKKETKNE
ncbi:hypothetical protein AALA22_13045 [Anaerovoracaceae bacterium 41-7]